MDGQLSKVEIGKDALESTLDVATQTVAKVTMIVTRAVRDVARALGELGTELFEIRDSSKRAGSNVSAGIEHVTKR